MLSLRLSVLPLLALGALACTSGSRAGEPLGAVTEAAVVCPGNDTLPGINVSEFQGDIDWNAVKGSGLAFAVARIDDGTYLDPKFDTNWAQMKAVGIVRGAYQFFEPADDPSQLADILIQKMGPLGVGDLPPTLDVEVTGGQSPATITANIHTWVDKVQAATGRAPMIYVGKYFWNDNVGSGDFASLPLWLAAYVSPCPDTPNAWGTWKIWQHADNGSIPGIGGAVDLDTFMGTQADLDALASPPNKPPIGWIDGADCAAGVTGWSQDPDTPDAPIAVHLYFDSVPGQPGALAIPVLAGNHRPDLCQAIGSCDHGYALAIPAALADGAAHTVHAYGIDSAGGPNPELSGGPKTFTCAPAALPPGGVRRWITSPDVLAAWRLRFSDVSHRSDAEVNAYPDGPSLPAAPVVVQADDGTPEVWVIDTGVRRHVIDPMSLSAWHFDGAGGVVKMPAAQVYGYPRGTDFRPAPVLVQDSMPQVYVLDDPLMAAMGGSGGGGGSPGSGGSGGGAIGAGGSGAGGQRLPGMPAGSGGQGGGGASPSGASPGQGSGCSLGGGAGGEGAWVLFAAALGVAGRRRRQRG